METSFSCPCGSEVAAEGEWESDHADLRQRCPACGEEFIITVSSLGKASTELQADGGSQRAVAHDASGTSTAPRVAPLEVGEMAPDFVLPGVDDDGTDMFRLSEYTESGPVLLSFYPFDFSPVCENVLCRFRDIEWLRIAEEMDVFAISGDSTYSHQQFRDENGFNFSLLTDRLASVAEAYGVKYEEWENQPAVCQRAIFGINADRTIGYRWHSEDATDEPDLDDLDEALRWAEGRT